MAQSKKPRKKYRPRQRCELVSGNPVSMSIDRKRINGSRVSALIEMEMLNDWEHCPSLLQGAAEAIAMAIKTLEGKDDVNDLGDVMLDAIDSLVELSSQGHIWRKGKHADAITTGFDIACQILAGMPPEEKLQAWAWTRSVDLRIREEMASEACRYNESSRESSPG